MSGDLGVSFEGIKSTTNSFGDYINRIGDYGLQPPSIGSMVYEGRGEFKEGDAPSFSSLIARSEEDGSDVSRIITDEEDIMYEEDIAQRIRRGRGSRSSRLNTISSLQGFAHLQIPFRDIASATNNFDTIIGRGGFGNVYKGQLMWLGKLINIVAKRLEHQFGQGGVEFLKEISTLSRLEHKNLVSIVGFCDEGDDKIIIYKYEVNGSLDRYLSSQTLTWMQRLHICVGVARALSYVHHDSKRDYCVIHRDIKSANVLLDENWEAKLGDFGLCIENLATRRHRLVLSRAAGTPTYIDPVYMNTGIVTDKSDVYSFGVVLFEVLCGRLAFNVGDNDGGLKHLGPLAIQHYEDKKLDEMIDPNLRKQMDPQSFTIFSDTAYHCLNRHRSQRPNMENVAKRLEKALEHQDKYENPEQPKSTPSSNHLKGKNLEHLKIQLKDIMMATDNFADTNRIGFGGYGAVYKAELEHFDSKSLLTIEGKTKDELPKKRSSVAIKQIFSRQDEQGKQGFFAEIESLTSCNHHNIVSLLGFCDEEPQQILVYELASNGCLEDYLGNPDKLTTLTWSQRLKICHNVAHGLNYLHTKMIVHRDIKSANILLYENWEAKIADFGLSRFHPKSTVNTKNIAGTEVYLDPEYLKTGNFKKESDTYSFGVVMFEILCGRLAYEEIKIDNDKGLLTSMVRRHFSKGRLKEMIDPKINEEADNNFTLNRGPNQDSLDTFSNNAYQCVAEAQADRPTMEVVIRELEKALYFQENNKDNLKFSLEDIKLATQNFNDTNCIGRGGFGKAYKGQVPHTNGHDMIIVAKRLDRRYGQGYTEFLTELEILFDYKHENVIGLVGYCDEGGENIIVYEYASRGSLDKCLKDNDLTWMKRLQICIDVASGLDFLHETTVVKKEVVIHRDIKSSNILLNGNWKAQITDFGFSLICPIYQETDYVIENAVGTLGYCDPLYEESDVLTKESDIYSFGVVLFEILCGRLELERNHHERHLVPYILAKHKLNEVRVDEMVFEGIKEQVMPQSFTTYCDIAYRCLQRQREERPQASEVIAQLKKALEFQEDYEIWEPKLPADYKQIIQMSKSPESYSDKMKKDLYTMFCKGILLQEGNVYFKLGSNGERNELVSARTFLYKNTSYKWRSIRKSRFRRVAKMLDISNLEIQIKIKTKFLSPDVVYGVHLIFKFCDQWKFSNKTMYVNLTYKMGSETLHAYFATLREDNWMVIELCRFLNHKEDVDFEVLLESFSSYNRGSGAIYVQGIEFQAIDKVKQEEYEKLKEARRVLTSNSNVDNVLQLSTVFQEILKSSKDDVPDGRKEDPYCIQIHEDEKLWLSKVDGKKCHMLPAKVVLDNSPNDKFFNRKSSTQSRFQEVIEVLPRQVFGIKCKIEIQMLSPDTDYVCFLVFKLSEKCRGLHCPIKVRDLLHQENKEDGIIYFRFPNLWNLHDIDRVPRMRDDGWMEVNVWKFNSNSSPLKDDCIPVNLKLISYEGTMSGLIVCGLEIRPM